MDVETDHPDPPESLPREIVDFVQNTDMETLDDLETYIQRDLKARATAILESGPPEE